MNRNNSPHAFPGGNAGIALGVLVACLLPGTVLLATPEDNINLTVTPGATRGDVHLTWTGGGPDFTVYRSFTASGHIAPGNNIGTTPISPWNDSPPAASIIFYSVVGATCASDTPDLAFLWDPLESTCRHASLSIL